METNVWKQIVLNSAKPSDSGMRTGNLENPLRMEASGPLVTAFKEPHLIEEL